MFVMKVMSDQAEMFHWTESVQSRDREDMEQ